MAPARDRPHKQTSPLSGAPGAGEISPFGQQETSSRPSSDESWGAARSRVEPGRGQVGCRQEWWIEAPPDEVLPIEKVNRTPGAQGSRSCGVDASTVSATRAKAVLEDVSSSSGSPGGGGATPAEVQGALRWASTDMTQPRSGIDLEANDLEARDAERGLGSTRIATTPTDDDADESWMRDFREYLLNRNEGDGGDCLDGNGGGGMEKDARGDELTKSRAKEREPMDTGAANRDWAEEYHEYLCEKEGEAARSASADLGFVT